MRPRTTTRAWILGALAALSSCSLEVDEFTAAAPDSALDSSVADSTIDAENDTSSVETSSDSPAESTVDSPMEDADATVEDGDTSFVPDTDVDTGPEVDVGPPPPTTECGAVGPSGTDMVCISAKTLNLGASNATACPPSGCASEKPISVTVSQFVIDRYEVSVGEFRTWWSGGHPAIASNTTIFSGGTKTFKWKMGWPAPVEPSKATGCTWLGSADATNDNLRLNCIDWYTAMAFCYGARVSTGSIIGRLPTEAEWEAAASGGENRLFPWSGASTENSAFTSSEVDCAHAVFGGCSTLTPKDFAADWTPWGNTKTGVHDMAGSFAEWVLDGASAPLGAYSYTTGSVTDPAVDPTGSSSDRIARGGSFLSSAADLRAAARPKTLTPATTFTDTSIGFRCVRR